jgi:aryl-alcohol dehydrogenase-like predicted oxidoreductase
MRRLLRHVVDSGVTLIDTADCYGPEVSERLIAEALHPYPAELVIATKCGQVCPRPDSWLPAGRPERLKRCCDASLARLRLDCIDLYQLHVVDPEVPIEDAVGALAELRDAGKIRHIGLSNVTLEELTRARRVAPIASVQNRYNVMERDSDDVVDFCARHGTPFMPWFPLGRGRLADGATAVDAVAATKGATGAQIALAWLLHRSPVMLPIPGTSSREHFDENMASAEIALTGDDLRALEMAAAAG